MLPYIKLFGDTSMAVDMLSDEEAGRLMKALLHYVNGEVVEPSGQEKLVFAMLRAQFNRDAAAYESYCEKQRENGKKGGRPRNPMVISNNPDNPVVNDKNPKNQVVFPKTQKSQEEDKDNNNILPPIIPPQEEAEEIQADHDEILDKMRYVGFSMTVAEMDWIIDLYTAYGKDAVLSALDECVGAKNKKRYVDAVLKKPQKKEDGWEFEVARNLIG